MKTHFLSRKERETGRKHYFSFTLFNGLGFGFLADTTIYLLAIHFGASNLQLGYISSLIYLSGVVLVFTPQMIQGRNLINVFFWSWFLRGAVCVINVFVLFGSDQTAVAIIMATYTLFCIFRMIGSSLINPVIQMVSTTATVGEMLTHNTAYFNLGSIFGKVGSFLLVSITFFKGVAGLLILQAAGFIFNTIASMYIKKIPCRERVEIPPGQNVIRVLRKHITNRSKLLPMLLYWNFLSLTVFTGFSIPLLRKIIGFEQNIVFLYTIVIAVATTVSMYMTRPFIDKVSSKPFIIATCFFDLISFVLWAFIKPETSIYLIFALGFVSMFTKGINQSMIAKKLIFSIPHKEKVTYNSMVNFIAGIFALIFGFVAGIAGDFGEKYHPSFFNQYYMIFMIAAFVSLTSFILSFMIGEKNEKDYMGDSFSLFSLKNLRGLLDSYYLDATTDTEKRQAILVSLKYNSAPFALGEIRKILKNPLSSETEEVLKSLFIKPRQQLLNDIMNIADDKGSYHRASAIFALGAYPDDDVEKKLITYLDDDSARIRSTAAKSLARIDNKDYLDKFIELSSAKENSIWDLINYIVAILTVEINNSYLEKIFEVADSNHEKSFKQSIYSIFARMLDLSPPLNEIYQQENVERFSGLRSLLEEARQFEFYYKYNLLINDLYASSDYAGIAVLVKETLRNSEYDEPYNFINIAIQKFDSSKADETDAVAIIYFGFNILVSRTED